jgi:hypothetical protein
MSKSNLAWFGEVALCVAAALILVAGFFALVGAWLLHK